MAVKLHQQQYFSVEISPRYSRLEKVAIAQEIIDYVRDRTRSGKDNEGNRFKGYSGAYVKSLNFRIAGKSKGKVDLTLTGDMLDGLKMLPSPRGEIKIGYDKGSQENEKAEGNQLGTYGKPKPIPGKARPFLGFESRRERQELARILSRYPLEDRELSRERALIQAAARGEEDEPT